MGANSWVNILHGAVQESKFHTFSTDALPKGYGEEEEFPVPAEH